MLANDMLENFTGVMGSPTNLACAGVLLVVLYLFLSKWLKARPLANLRGPPSASWTFGGSNSTLTATWNSCKLQVTSWIFNTSQMQGNWNTNGLANMAKPAR